MPWNTYPYTENYFLSFQRQFGQRMMFSASYVGSQAHHLLLVYSNNPGNPALVPFAQPAERSRSRDRQPAGHSAKKPPTPARPDRFITERAKAWARISATTTTTPAIGNANYNALELTLRYTTPNLNFLVGYTWSKSIDQASSISDPGNPYNFSATRALSAFDIPQNLVVSYQYNLPFERFFGHIKGLTSGWQISGITRINSGFPVSLHSDGDNSLMGSNPNGVNNYSLDLPDYNGQPLNINSNPRNGKPYFNINAFTLNALGTPGNASRRSFIGPGEINFDLALLKTLKFTESKILQIRIGSFQRVQSCELFRTGGRERRHQQHLFGQVVNAAPPREVQSGGRSSNYDGFLNSRYCVRRIGKPTGNV